MQRRRIVDNETLPAPVKGWDAKNSIANMDKLSAVRLVNWWPTTSDVLMRKGYIQHATGLPDQVETLMAYESQSSGNDRLFAASGTAFYDVSSSGAVGSSVVSSLTNARWQYENFTDSGGTHYLIAVNGADDPRYWNGTSWIAVNGASSPAITGITTNLLINVTVHKKFLWFVEKDSTNLWYLPTGAAGGAATQFGMDSVFKKGGFIVDIGTWTLDAGDGVDDYFAIMTSEGECAIYRGTNPGSASTWALVGVWALADPIGNRVFMKYGGDLLAILEDGVQPMSVALLSSQVNRETALTDNIRGAMSDAATLYNNKFGWELLHYPRANMLILNVPTETGSMQEQYVMNTITGAWADFTGIEANCWALFNKEPYFGGDEIVGQFWFDFADNDANIEADAQQAFHYFGSRGENKRWTMARPIFQAIGTPAVSIGLNINYSTEDPTSLISFVAPDFSVWDTDTWDVAEWGGTLSSTLDWGCVSGIGFCAAARLKAESKGVEVRWVGTDFVFERGHVPL